MSEASKAEQECGCEPVSLGGWTCPKHAAPTQTVEQVAKVYANSRAVERDVQIGSMTWSEYKREFLAGWQAATKNAIASWPFIEQDMRSEFELFKKNLGDVTPAATKGREWWLACDGFDRFYTAYDSYEAAKTGRTMNPIHVSEVIRPVSDPKKGERS